MGRSDILLRIVSAAHPAKGQRDKDEKINNIHFHVQLTRSLTMRKQLVHLFGGITAEEVRTMIAEETNNARVAAELFGTGTIAEVRANAEEYLAEAVATREDHDALVAYLQDALNTATANAKAAAEVQARVQTLYDGLPAPDFKVEVTPFVPVLPHLMIIEMEAVAADIDDAKTNE